MKDLKATVPYGVVFLTSMGVMILELVASRLVSKYLGNSLYTWTSVIGIVLGGISLGNALGGKLADRFPPERIVAPLLLAASLLTFLILILDLLVARIAQSSGFQGFPLGLLVRAILLITVLFFLPACALGTISPVMAKYALSQQTWVGRTVGGIYAFGSLGSILGTFLTGYLLIPLLGLSAIVLLVGILLALLAFLFEGVRVLSGGWAILLLALLICGAPRGWEQRTVSAPGETRRSLEAKDSAYSYIRVEDVERGGSRERILRLDALIHNRYDPLHPDILLYDYEKIFASLTRQVAEAVLGGQDFVTLTIGGGAFLFPAYLERHYPFSRHEVVEIDVEVIRTAFRYFDLPQNTRLGIFAMDGRAYVDRALGGGRYDFIYMDAFNSFSIPQQLTTREFAAKVFSLLGPRGVYLANCIDVLDEGGFLNAYLNTLRSVFPHVAVYKTPRSGPGQRATYILAGSRIPLAGETLSDEAGSAVAERLPEADLERLRARKGDVVLTDDYAPVENLIAPVFLRSVR